MTTGDFCDISDGDRPKLTVPLWTEVPQYNDEVTPSPEHLERIQKAEFQEIKNAKVKKAAEAQRRAQREKEEMDELAECIGFSQISVAAQGKKAPQASQANSSAAGRGNPAEGAQPGRGDLGGRGGHTDRGAAAPPPTSSIVRQGKRRADSVLSDGESRRRARKTEMEAREQSPRDKGYASLGDGPSYEQIVEGEYVPRETAEATKQAEPSLAHMVSGSNEMQRLELFVPNPDEKFMAELWAKFDKALDYPSRAGFTCSGKPWEVKVHGGHAELFYGHQGCLWPKIIGHISSMTKARIYALWEGDFIHIGLMTQMNAEWTREGHDGELLMFLMSASGAFRFVADWARKVKAGEHICFTDFMENHAKADAHGASTQEEQSRSI